MCNNIFLVSQKHYAGTQEAHHELVRAWLLPGIAQVSELVEENQERAGVCNFMLIQADG